MTIKILVNGAHGKMGQETVKAIKNTQDLLLVGEADHQDDLVSAIHRVKAEVVVDFTVASEAFNNALKIIEAGAHPVIGTSGLNADAIEELTRRCAEKKLGGIIAPNFSIGAILMMQYAQNCARYFSHVEIIEMHCENKLDAPSATALRTAQLISEAKPKRPVNVSEKELLPGARGCLYEDVPIHSIRLPGLIARQSVIFGGEGQTLTICHDTASREAFMPGVCLACRKVVGLDRLVYGLEHILT